MDPGRRLPLRHSNTPPRRPRPAPNARNAPAGPIPGCLPVGSLPGSFRCCSSLISRTAIDQGTGVVPPYLDLNQACCFPGGVAVLIQRMIRPGLLTYSISLKRVGGQMRAFFLVAVMALLIDVPVTGAAAHDGWFVRVCRAKTEADRIHLAFSGGRQGYSWSWIKAGPRTRSTSPAGFTPWSGSPCAAARPRRPPISNRTPMSVSGSAITSFSAWNSTITRITRRTGMIRMIVPANNTHH